jgi:hypothetical protein
MASKRKSRSNNAGLALNQAQSIDKIVHDGAPIPDELADLFASLDSTSKDITPQADIYADDEGNIVAFGFQLSQRGIDPASFQDDEDMWWNTLGWLFELEGKLSLFIGDLLVGMDIKYGVSYEAIAERFGYEVKTLYNYHHICKHVDFSLRKENLSMSHYNLVTGKPAEMQGLYLTTASEQNWSVAKLRAFIKENETPVLLKGFLHKNIMQCRPKKSNNYVRHSRICWQKWTSGIANNSHSAPPLSSSAQVKTA